MTDKIVILSTCESEKEATNLARMLVDERLAACVNVMPRMQSFYRWKGSVETAGEFLLLIKTARQLFPKVAEAIRKAHSYEVPEVLALPVVDGSEDYLGWMQENVLGLDGVIG